MKGVNLKRSGNILHIRNFHAGMVIALIEDLEGELMVVQSCPSGSRLWSLRDAASLPKRSRVWRALGEAARIGYALQMGKGIRSRTKRLFLNVPAP